MYTIRHIIMHAIMGCACLESAMRRLVNFEFGKKN